MCEFEIRKFEQFIIRMYLPANCRLQTADLIFLPFLKVPLVMLRKFFRRAMPVLRCLHPAVIVCSKNFLLSFFLDLFQQMPFAFTTQAGKITTW
jgi:hypothetical protein